MLVHTVLTQIHLPSTRGGSTELHWRITIIIIIMTITEKNQVSLRDVYVPNAIPYILLKVSKYKYTKGD